MTSLNGSSEIELASGDLASSLVQADVSLEQSAATESATVLPDDLLPGVGGEEMSLRDGIRSGGMATLVILGLLTALDQLANAGLSVLAPNIRDSLHVSNGTIVFISAASGGFLVLGALPMGWLADRYRRAPIIGWASLAFSAMLALSGLAINAFMLFWTQLGAGISKANTFSVQWSLLADRYPIRVRGRVFSVLGFGTQLAGAVSPLLMAGIATAVGGSAGWRWSFIVLAIPAAVVGLLAFRLPEPVRGQYEKEDVVGQVFADEKTAPVSIEAAFARIRSVKTLRIAMFGFAALGFGLFTAPVLSNLFLQQQYGLSTLGRGLVGTITAPFVLIVIPFVGKRYDKLYRASPSRAVAMLGALLMPAALLTPVQYFMPTWVLFMIVGIPQIMLVTAAYTMAGPVFQSVLPYRLRGLGSALGGLYIFFIGATGGALLAAFLTNEFGVRVAVLVLLIPSTLVGGFLFFRSAAFVKSDLAVAAAEVKEELAEYERRQADPDAVPHLQLKDIDYSYGPVQVLFGVSLEVQRGEVLALVGTNGAGKSSVLRVISGLGTPSRGVVRLAGQTITYVAPEHRVRLGVQMVPGGKATFGSMTVAENLEMAAYTYRRDVEQRDRRIRDALELFPLLAERRSDLAGSLSGGQQQMLGLARALLHEPEVLLIDELSLGLAPLVVQELIGVLGELKARGITMIVVEQSLSVAAQIADRAVFLEKGEVRFEGSCDELLNRDDLARAVFLGAEGG